MALILTTTTLCMPLGRMRDGGWFDRQRIRLRIAWYLFKQRPQLAISENHEGECTAWVIQVPRG